MSCKRLYKHITVSKSGKLMYVGNSNTIEKGPGTWLPIPHGFCKLSNRVLQYLHKIEHMIVLKTKKIKILQCPQTLIEDDGAL